MSFMRWTGVIAILLILMMLLAGCGQRVPGKGSNTTTTPLWGGQKVREYNASADPGATVTGTPPVVYPTAGATSGPVAVATIIPESTVTVTPGGTYRNPPPPINLTANYTVIYDQSLIFTWNATAVTYELLNPPLVIDYTLTVPNITRTRQATDPVSGGDITVTSTYPDPQARFEIIVRDPVTMKVFAQDGYGGQYDVAYSKQLRVLYPGKYHIQMSGNKVTAHVKFTVLKTAA